MQSPLAGAHWSRSRSLIAGGVLATGLLAAPPLAFQTTAGRRYLTKNSWGILSERAKRDLASEVVSANRYPTLIGDKPTRTKIPVTWNPASASDAAKSPIADEWTTETVITNLDGDSSIDLYAVRQCYPQLFRTAAETQSIERASVFEDVSDGDDWLYGRQPKPWHLFKEVAQQVAALPTDEATKWLDQYAADHIWFEQLGYPVDGMVGPHGGIFDFTKYAVRQYWLEAIRVRLVLAVKYAPELFLDERRAQSTSIQRNRIIWAYGIHSAADFQRVLRAFSEDKPFALANFDAVRRWTKARIDEHSSRNEPGFGTRTGNVVGDGLVAVLDKIRRYIAAKPF